MREVPGDRMSNQTAVVPADGDVGVVPCAPEEVAQPLLPEEGERENDESSFFSKK